MNPKALMDLHELQPKKSLGQNFLHDPNALDKIVATAEITPDDVVVEIGPGTGTLTERLAEVAKRVIAIELDERLKPILDDRVVNQFSHVWMIYKDVLEVDIAGLVYPEDYMVVANVPYYITSAILRHLLETRHRPRRLVLTIQREVAERIVAKPGDMSLLAVSVQYYGAPKIITRLNPAAFWPRPDAHSAVLRVDVYDTPPVDVPDDKTFFRVAQAGFSLKRKQLKNSVGKGLGIGNSGAADLLESVGIDPRRRAETLSLEEWAALARGVAALSA